MREQYREDKEIVNMKLEHELRLNERRLDHEMKLKQMEIEESQRRVKQTCRLKEQEIRNDGAKQRATLFRFDFDHAY